MLSLLPLQVRAPGQRVVGKGKVNPGFPPTLNLLLKQDGRPEDKKLARAPTYSRVCVESVPYPLGSADERMLHVWNARDLEGILSVDAKGIFTQASLGAQLLFGYTEEEIVGSPAALIIPAPPQAGRKGVPGDSADARSALWFSAAWATNIPPVGRVVEGVHRRATAAPLSRALLLRRHRRCFDCRFLFITPLSFFLSLSLPSASSPLRPTSFCTSGTEASSGSLWRYPSPRLSTTTTVPSTQRG